MRIKTSPKKTLRSQVYDEIKRRILYMEVRPGDKLFDSDIAAELNVSRTPVREALLVLESEKLIECDSRIGFAVKRLTPKEVEEYFALRKALELFAVPLILERITPNEIAALKENIAAAEDAGEKMDIKKLIQYETDFHNRLYMAAKSEIFYQTISSLTDKFQLIRAAGMISFKGPVIQFSEHKKIIEAIEQKNHGLFSELMEKHLEHAAKGFLQSSFAAFL